jgi:hypothetical protein
MSTSPTVHTARTPQTAQRHWCLLDWLLRYPFQRADDLALALNVPLSRVYRDLASCLNQGWLEVIIPARLSTTTCRLYCLSQRGLEAVAEHEQEDVGELVRRYGCDEATYLRLIPRLPYLLPMQQCLTSLMHYAPSVYTIRGRRCRVLWWWQRDYWHGFVYRERPVTCTADAILCWQTQPVSSPQSTRPSPDQQEPGRWYSLIVLLDTGLYDRAWMQQRLVAWIQWRESAGQRSSSSQFPPLLLLVPAAHRISYWREAMRALCHRLDVTPLEGAIIVLPPLAPMRAPRGVHTLNAWTLPWNQLAVAAPARLQEICQPIPLHTVLPGLTLSSSHKVKSLPEPSASEQQQGIEDATFLKGQWQQRARQALHIPVVSLKKEQREMPTWLSLLLGCRYLELLLFIWKYPLLPTETMAMLLTLHPDSVSRYLRVLQQYGCLQRWPAPGSEAVSMSPGSGPGWSLSERGLRLLAAMHHVHLLRVGVSCAANDPERRKGRGATTVQPKHLAEAQRYLAHWQGLYWFLGQMQQNASQAEQRILWWETGAWCEHSYEEEGQRRTVRPDAAVAYAGPDGRSHTLWIEWDRGTMNRRDLMAKCATNALPMWAMCCHASGSENSIRFCHNYSVSCQTTGRKSGSVR